MARYLLYAALPVPPAIGSVSSNWHARASRSRRSLASMLLSFLEAIHSGYIRIRRLSSRSSSALASSIGRLLPARSAVRCPTATFMCTLCCGALRGHRYRMLPNRYRKASVKNRKKVLSKPCYGVWNAGKMWNSNCCLKQEACQSNCCNLEWNVLSKARTVPTPNGNGKAAARNRDRPREPQRRQSRERQRPRCARGQPHARPRRERQARTEAARERPNRAPKAPNRQGKATKRT